MTEIVINDKEIEVLLEKCHSIRDNLKKSIDEILEYARVFEPKNNPIASDDSKNEELISMEN